MDDIRRTLEPAESAEFFKNAAWFLLAEAAEPVYVTIYNRGREIFSATVEVGFKALFSDGFERIRIRNDNAGALDVTAYATAAEVDVQVRVGVEATVVNTAANPVPCDILGATLTVSDVTIKNAAVTQAAGNVTNASAQLLAAKADRRYLLIQNKSASGTIWLNVAGVAATQANGIKIDPNGQWERSDFIFPGAITAIGDLAANPDVVIVEG